MVPLKSTIEAPSRAEGRSEAFTALVFHTNQLEFLLSYTDNWLLHTPEERTEIESR